MDEWYKTATPEGIHEQEGQFSSEFNKLSNKPYLHVFGKMPPAAPWDRLEAGLQALGETFGAYREDSDARTFIMKSFASLNLILNAVQRICANISSSYVESTIDKEAEEEFMLHRMAVISAESPLSWNWDVNTYAKMLVPFVRDALKTLGGLKTSRDLDTVIGLSAYERRLLWITADMEAAYERIKQVT